MKHKPLQIDWDELETAFENRNEDLTYYLDLVTGHVILDGEGEDAHFDEDAEMDDAVDPDAAPRDESTRLYVVSFTDDDEIDWMDEFIEGRRRHATGAQSDPCRLRRVRPVPEVQGRAEASRRRARSLVPVSLRAPARGDGRVDGIEQDLSREPSAVEVG
jgi:hypothetical protein